LHFIYIDDSGDEHTRAFTALAIPELQWKDTFDQIKQFRRLLKSEHKIFVTVEWHATNFVAGRGRIATCVIPKGKRCAIYKEALHVTAKLPGIRMFNAMAPKAHERLIFERLMTRIDRTMKEWKSNAVIVHDEGKDYTPLVRRMGVYNLIKSKYETWPDGNEYKNFPLNRVLEDIFFRDSVDSYFIQLADFCAYALFRSEHVLVGSRAKYELEKAFDTLIPIAIPECFANDPRKLGIIRET
jgi:hypothetical protein